MAASKRLGLNSLLAMFLLATPIWIASAQESGEPFVSIVEVASRLFIYSDGKVEYFDDYKGKATSPITRTLNREQIRSLTAEFENANFFSLNDVYTTGQGILKDGTKVSVRAVSMPATKITFSDKGKRKTVAYTIGAPEPLMELREQVEKIAGVPVIKKNQWYTVGEGGQCQSILTR